MKSNTPTFVIELLLCVNDQQNRFLTQAFEFGRTLYNATLGSALGRLQRMRESLPWRQTRSMPKGKERSERFSDLQKAYGLTENGLRTIANNHRKASGRNDIGAHEAQCVGRTVWRALERYMFLGAGKPRFKSYRQGLNSIEGTDNHEIMFKPDRQSIVWRKQVLKLMIPDTSYFKEALADPIEPTQTKRIKYCRIVRRTLNGKKRWFAQICLEGMPPVRKIYAPRSEVIGIDPGPSGLAYFHPQKAGLIRVAPNVDMQEKAIRRLQRKIDRSRRANNPSHFNADGTAKPSPTSWKISRRMEKLQVKLAEHHRCLAATRKRDHGELANFLLQRAGTIKIEKNSYRSYQRNFGKSTTRTGMGTFVSHLKRSAERANSQVIELDAYELKLSQYDPATDTYRKKLLKEREHRWGETDVFVQRDVMSAYLACYATENGHDRALLLEKWPTAEALLSGSGLCRHEPRNDPGVSKDASGLTKPRRGNGGERRRGLPQTPCAENCPRAIRDVQSADGESRRAR